MHLYKLWEDGRESPILMFAHSDLDALNRAHDSGYTPVFIELVR